MEENEKKYCADCGELIEENENFYELENGDIICESCFDDNYFYCEICGQITHRDDEIYLHDTEEYVCRDCAENGCFCCCDCQEYYRHDNGIINRDGDWICEDCRESYVYCYNCQEYYHEDDVTYCESNDEYYCNDCYEELREGDILDYHEFNDWQLFKNKSENKVPFYIGFELETVPKYGNTCNQKEALQILKENLNVVMAHDGSLDSGGFEIISHPQSFKYIMNNRGKYKETFKKLVDLGYLSHNTDCCGLHFHVTRPENQDVIDKIWLVMETYKEEIFKLSRRSSGELNHWARFLSDSSYADNEKLKALYYIKKTDKNGTRYMALNNTNTKTIEFRFFRGTLNYNTFMASIEFINNLVTLCSDDNLKVTKINWNMLCKGHYISKYIKDREIYTDKKIIDDSLKIIKLENKQKSIMNKINKILMNYSKKRVKSIKFEINNVENLYDSMLEICKLRDKFKEIINNIENFPYLDDYYKSFNIDSYLSSLKNFISCNAEYIENEELEKLNVLKDELIKTTQKNINLEEAC